MVALHVDHFCALLVHSLEGLDDGHVGFDHACLADPEFEDVAKQNQRVRFAALLFEEGQHGLVVRIGRLVRWASARKIALMAVTIGLGFGYVNITKKSA